MYLVDFFLYICKIMIKQDKRNYRKHSDKNKALINKSLNELGAGRSILIDADNEIIAGNGVHSQWGDKPIRVIETDGSELIAIKRTDLHTEDDKRKRLAIMDNSSSDSSEFDMELLQCDFETFELEEMGVELPAMEDKVLEAEEDDFDVPEGGIETDIVLGDLFEIGEHRLLCGDSTDSDQVAKLMNGQKAELVFTDPPYGNGSSGKYGRGQLGVRTILNDDTFECVNDFFNLRICDAYVFFLQWRTFKEAIQTLENNDLILKTIAVWDKKNAGLNGAGGMAEQWEAIIVAGNIKYSRFGGNVFNVSREQKKRIDSPHPHQKPIQLLSDILEYFQDYKLLVDPFSGSGSTMVASHQLKRKCYGMELDPKYCQVIVDRMKKLDPTLIIKKNGLPL